MYVAGLSTGAILANNAFSFNGELVSTNDNVKTNSANNGLLIVNPGIYKVRLQAVITAGTEGEIGAELYTNGTAVSVTNTVITLGSGDDGEIVIEYPVNVVSVSNSEQALVQFYAVQPGTIVNGYVTVERIS